MITPYLSEKLLKGLLGFYNNTYSGWSIPVCYIGLTNAEPIISGTTATATEPSSSLGYARIAVRNNSSSWTSGPYFRFDSTDNNISMHNIDEIHFNAATGDWGTMNYICLFDALTNGNLLAYTKLTTPITVASTYVPTISIGDAIIRVDNPTESGE